YHDDFYFLGHMKAVGYETLDDSDEDLCMRVGLTSFMQESAI
ncbi:hypothetical protein AVEN_259779-1, partial [Araneus ventricosus]